MRCIRSGAGVCGNEDSYELSGKTDVGINGTWNCACFGRRLYGCIFLCMQGRCICECADRKYAVAGGTHLAGRIFAGTALSFSGACICNRNRTGRHRALPPTGEKSDPLAADLGLLRSSRIIRGQLSVTGYEPSGKQPDVLCLRHTGRELPKDPWKRNRNDDVYR